MNDQPLLHAGLTKAGNAMPGTLLGLLLTGHIGLAAGIGALVSAALWPSIKSFLINVAEWLFGKIQRRFDIPFVAPKPYLQVAASVQPEESADVALPPSELPAVEIPPTAA